MTSSAVKTPQLISHRHNAFTLPGPRERSSAFTLPKLRGRSSAFTLVEMLVVIGVIAILLVAVIPAVNSLSKSSGRKAAVSNLLGAIEQARAQAIKDGQFTYVAFPTQLPGSPDTATTQRYSYHSFAIFEYDLETPTAPKQLTPWKTLPTGVSFRSKADSPTGEKHGGLPPLPLPPIIPPDFAFQPTTGTAKFPYLKFNSNGELEWPLDDTLLVVFEGFVSGTSEVIEGAKDSANPPNPLAAEALSIGHLTGRAEPTVTPAPSS